MVAQDPATLRLIEAGADVAQLYKQQAAQCKPYFLYNAVIIANDCDFNYRNSRNKRLSVEIAIIRICQLMNPVAPPQQPQKAPLQQSQQPQLPQQPQQPQQPVAAPMPRPAQPAPQAAAPRPSYGQPMPGQYPQQPPQQPPVQHPQMQRGAPPSAGRPPMMASMRNGANAPVQGTPAGQQSTGAKPQQRIEVDEPVDEPALRRTWKQYINTIPEEKLLQTAIQNSTVQLLEGTHIGVTVTSEEQMQRLTSKQGELLNYLRQQLRNTKLEMTFAVSKGENVKLAFTPRERLAEMREETPELLDELVNTFGLELS